MRTAALLSILSLSPLAASGYTGSAFEPVSFDNAPLNVRNGSTRVEAVGTQTEGRWAFDISEKKTPWLEQYGTAEIKHLFKGLTTPAGTHPISEKYNTGGANDITAIDDDTKLRFNDTNDNYRFRTAQLGITQHLFTGLFARAMVRLSEQRITQAISADGTDKAHANVVALLADFDAVLKEFGGNALSSYTRKASIDHAAFFLGWQGKTTTPHHHISELSGSIAAGYQFTPPSFYNKLAPALLPHNVSDGFILHVNGFMRLMKRISIDASLAATIFNQRYGHHHIARDDDATATNTGPLLLGTGFVKKDPGNLWKASFNLNLDGFKGLYLQAGYQFSYQEKTELTLRDTTVLTSLAATPRVQHARLNSDPKLGSWKHHALTCAAGFRPFKDSWRLLPAFSVHYALPLWGHRSVHPAQVYGGSINLSLQWTF
ncbi:MAG: hypothetical protein PVJ92_00515 [Candidatus Dependentiae bacterium]|jgi:hypothetical protein